jgi:putative ABC transport system permease protein
VVYGFLIDPYPYKGADRMVHLRIDTGKGQPNGVGLTAGQWQQIRTSPVVDDAFLADEWNLTVTGADLPEDVNADYFSSNTFEYFGVPPALRPRIAALGRGRRPGPAARGRARIQILAAALRLRPQRARQDHADGPQELHHRRRGGPALYLGRCRCLPPQKITQDIVPPFYVGVRLKPGITKAAAESRSTPSFTSSPGDPESTSQPFHFISSFAASTTTFSSASAEFPTCSSAQSPCLLLIGCGNVSILLLARATTRNHEFAVRSAIGASRARIVRQLLTESLLISLTGAALGLFIAYRSLDLIVANLPQNSIPHEAAIHINLPVLLFCMAVAVATGILFGLWPAIQVSKPNVSQIMQAATRKVAGSVSGRRFHGTLIAGQLALTLLMLTTAGAPSKAFCTCCI